MYKNCSTLTIKTPEQRPSVFIVNSELISQIVRAVCTADLEQVYACWDD